MDYYRFFLSCSGFNLNDGWFLIVGSVFKPDPKSILVVATKEKNGCTFDKIEQLDKTSYKIFVKDITREHMGQRAKISLNIFYSSEEGDLFMQKIDYNDKSSIGLPKKINY